MEDAYEEFSPYYNDAELYQGDGIQNPKVLIARDGISGIYLHGFGSHVRLCGI